MTKLSSRVTDLIQKDLAALENSSESDIENLTLLSIAQEKFQSILQQIVIQALNDSLRIIEQIEVAEFNLPTIRIQAPLIESLNRVDTAFSEVDGYFAER